MDRWPHQIYGFRAVLAALDEGVKRICLTSPTGGGKTAMIRDIGLAVLSQGRKVALYTNRRLLVDQLSASLAEARIPHGVRAADNESDLGASFQICSVQTETARVLKRRMLELHACNPGDLAAFDEGHLHRGPKVMEIRRRHLDGGAATLDVTATPLGMQETADLLIVAGTPSELRACGALARAIHYGCDEPDLRAFKKLRQGDDPSESQQRTAMMTPGIMGRVWAWYQKTNPERKPSLLFGPGVAESLWFAEQFTAKGVAAAHIDGDDCWVDGRWYKSDDAARNDIRERHRAGDIKVVCNRYVLREGADWPWIVHIILAFVAGSLQTYLQTVGRGLRAYPGKEFLYVQDHGGAWHRHGSVNEDRDWQLEFTDHIAFGLRAERIRNKKERAPFLCPACKRVWVAGTRPCECGHVLDRSLKSRAVVGTEGQVRELSADVFQPRRITHIPLGPAIWERMYWRSRTEKGRRSFAAAAALFAQENYFGWPDRGWPFMPLEDIDFFRLVEDVPFERLVQKQTSPALV